MPKIIEQGFVLSIGDHINDVITWRTEKDGKPHPVIYPTIDDARKELAGQMVDQYEQYIKGEREWDEIDQWQEEEPKSIAVYDNGTMIINGIEYNTQDWQNQFQ